MYFNSFPIVVQHKDRYATKVLIFQPILYTKIFRDNGLVILGGWCRTFIGLLDEDLVTRALSVSWAAPRNTVSTIALVQLVHNYFTLNQWSYTTIKTNNHNSTNKPKKSTLSSHSTSIIVMQLWWIKFAMSCFTRSYICGMAALSTPRKWTIVSIDRITYSKIPCPGSSSYSYCLFFFLDKGLLD